MRKKVVERAFLFGYAVPFQWLQGELIRPQKTVEISIPLKTLKVSVLHYREEDFFVNT